MCNADSSILGQMSTSFVTAGILAVPLAGSSFGGRLISASHKWADVFRLGYICTMNPTYSSLSYKIRTSSLSASWSSASGSMLGSIFWKSAVIFLSVSKGLILSFLGLSWHTSLPLLWCELYLAIAVKICKFLVSEAISITATLSPFGAFVVFALACRRRCLFGRKINDKSIWHALETRAFTRNDILFWSQRTFCCFPLFW
mmetsp:Transcript_13942/g.30387  ORF Transcript_13942/g.30387 Transcript_13942/m.30387 type:complete len:201 (+) Transcript_13942:54-656(+)